MDKAEIDAQIQREMIENAQLRFVGRILALITTGVCGCYVLYWPLAAWFFIDGIIAYIRLNKLSRELEQEIDNS